MRLFQPIATFLALVSHLEQSCKRPFGDLSMHICRHSKKLLVSLAEYINSAIRLGGIRNAGWLLSSQGETTGAQCSVYTWFIASLTGKNNKVSP